MARPAGAVTPGQGDVTRLLARARAGGQPVLDQLFSLIYDELYRIAQWQLRGERADHTLGATEIVHEAYLRLVGADAIAWQDRGHFLAVAAGAMRRLLIDHARRRSALKRGGPHEPVHLDERLLDAGHEDERLLELDEALRRLEALLPRQARVVECRFFAGLTLDETAHALGIARATAARDWALARAWLYRELNA
jgi:RNA polymerase sigma factor (TIGR02999 family)